MHKTQDERARAGCVFNVQSTKLFKSLNKKMCFTPRKIALWEEKSDDEIHVYLFMMDQSVMLLRD